MDLRIYNSLTRRKEEFEPLEPNHVRMYVCGVTVYDECHIGHARSAVVFDVIYRWFLYKGYRITYVRNFTDIDDKILDRARKEGAAWDEIARRYIASFREDMESLGVLKPTFEPLATEHIPEMIEMIKALEAKGVAYCVDGNVYFSVSSFPQYGKLSRRDRDEMIAGARVEPDERKKDPLDFALWKKSAPGEPFWESPWGPGRPGWHIECSCMSQKYLGQTLDIHGGGLDLVFPHHENEIAQSEALTGRPFARFWIHNGPLTRDGVKMSKSLGNILSIKEALKRYHPEELRLFFLSAHYRKPLDFTPSGMMEAQVALERLYGCLERLEGLKDRPSGNPARAKAPQDGLEVLETFPEKFQEAMDDDFNTPRALSHVFDLVRTLNQWMDSFKGDLPESTPAVIAKAQGCFSLVSSTLGILSRTVGTFRAEKEGLLLSQLGIARDEIEVLITKRSIARKNKDFSEADRIRNELLERGIQLLDTPEGTKWRIKPGAIS